MAWQAALPLIGGALGGIGDFFGKDEGQVVNQELMMPDWQKNTGSTLASYLQKYLPQYNPNQAYTGKLTAGKTGQEQTSLELLNSIMGKSPTGDAFQAGKGQIMDTLSGKYADPNQSSYIKSQKVLANQGLEDAIDASRRSAGSRGNYFSKAALGEERQLTNRTQNYVNDIIGKFQETERGRQFSAAPIAQQMDQYQNLTAPLAQVAAGQTYGALDRNIEQGDLERQYQDFTRRQTAMGQLPGQAQSMYSTQPSYGMKSMQMPDQQNTIGRIMNAAGSGIDMASGLQGLMGGMNLSSSDQSLVNQSSNWAAQDPNRYSNLSGNTLTQYTL